MTTTCKSCNGVGQITVHPYAVKCTDGCCDSSKGERLPDGSWKWRRDGCDRPLQFVAAVGICPSCNGAGARAVRKRQSRREDPGFQEPGESAAAS